MTSWKTSWMRRRRFVDVVVASAGLLVLVACGFVVRDGTVGSLELRVFHAINGLPDALTPVMNAAQLLGVLVVGPAVAVAALILRRWRLAVAALLVTAGKLLAERTVWELVQRSRPGTIDLGGGASFPGWWSRSSRSRACTSARTRRSTSSGDWPSACSSAA